MVVTLTFDGGKATGTAAMGGPAQPISVDIGGPLFADGPGAFRSIAALPLKDGYTVTFRNFDPMKRKAGVKQAKVVALEDVTVPAGTFKAWKVEIKSAEGEPGDQTIWIDSTSRRIVKVIGDAAGDGWRDGDDGAAEVGRSFSCAPPGRLSAALRTSWSLSTRC